MTIPKTCNAEEAGELVRRLGAEFAVVQNPAYVHPAYEIYPLAPAPAGPLVALRAVVCDMDGTSTTTEPLCVYSLENMVRRMTHQNEKSQWGGLTGADHPHVIGNSTTRHVEYLVRTYGDRLEKLSYLSALIEAVLWTLACGRDRDRKTEARATAVRLGLGPVLESEAARHLIADPEHLTLDQLRHVANHLALGCIERFEPGGTNELVRGGIEIYYARYHQILEAIGVGEGNYLARQLLGEGRRLIEPMPGVALFLCVLKGIMTPEEAEVIFDATASDLLRRKERPVPEGSARSAIRGDFMSRVARFIGEPVRVAIVTSSLGTEAAIVLQELFEVVREEISAWPLSREARERICGRLLEPGQYYDAIITASDSSEIRLKPHRDLYSLALHRLGIGPEDFDKVLGLEDSESGITGIRAAGINMAVAVPFAQTLGHDLSRAAKLCPGGLPQVMFEERFFVK